MKALPAFLAGTACAVCATVALQSFAQESIVPQTCRLPKELRDSVDVIQRDVAVLRNRSLEMQSTLEKMDTRVGDLWSR
jgi:hypothetical protein